MPEPAPPAPRTPRSHGQDGVHPRDAIAPPRAPGVPRTPGADFAVGPRAAAMTGLAIPVGAAVALVALGLVLLIGVITHLAYTGTWGTDVVQPDTSVLGWASVLVPVAGGLVIGLMARYGSERIRGHGIPEAMEAVLLRGSRMPVRIALLKPLSSAISVGTGGPFGAEGPIIVTGGAVGSIAGQHLHLTAAERRSLLAAGAAAGMTAIFATPLAAILLAVELLLFEWRPRSLLPVAAAATTALVVRSALAAHGLLPQAPLFPLHVDLGGQASAIPAALLVGVACGGLAWVATKAIYAAEDLFGRLPVHWAWWPAIGGLVVGLGGLVDPRVLGVGYAVIDDELAGRLALGALAAVLVVKLVVWAIALGSNTSGGVLAPLLLLGGALGGLLGSVVPGGDPALWAALGMAAAFSGTMRAPLTGVVFALETTGRLDLLPALVAACGTSYGLSVLTMRRSILTERLARRGHQITCEYEVDPMRALRVEDVLPTGPAACATGTVPPGAPVVHADEPLRAAADRMVAFGCDALSVVAAGDPDRTIGVVRAVDLLRGHGHRRTEEHVRERPLAFGRPVPSPPRADEPGRRPVAAG